MKHKRNGAFSKYALKYLYLNLIIKIIKLKSYFILKLNKWIFKSTDTFEKALNYFSS